MNVVNSPSTAYDFLLAAVLTALPLHAEEGNQRESVLENEIVNRMIGVGANQESATLLAEMVRRQLQALALLDRAELNAGRWAFVSFPASLLGRSMVEILATPDQAILPADYWEQGDYRPLSIKEEQRRLLHKIESGRVQRNSAAKPVRTVHVAWAVIRIQDSFLLHRREDIVRPGEKSHVFPGGRFNLNDLPPCSLALPDVLRQIFQPDSPLVLANLHATLTRELHEELGLLHNNHYSFEHWQDLTPYRQVNGAGNRHAYTEYCIRLYTTKLTPTGEIHLLDRETHNPAELAWFSATEIAAPHRANGDAAYVDALHASWGKELVSRLLQAPDSISPSAALTSQSQMLDLPATPKSGIRIGKPGKEKLLPLELTNEEWQFLMLLGWHIRGFAIEIAECITLLGRGWVRIKDKNLLAVGLQLQQALEKHLPGLLEIRDGHYFFLRIHPHLLMFNPELFMYSIQGSNKEGGILAVQRRHIDTLWGHLRSAIIHKPVTGNTICILRELERGDDPSGSADVKAGDWEKNLREQLSDLKALGLRRIWTTRLGTSTLVEGLKRIDGAT